ncbi:hypothetical protein Ddc_14383 [Ditylenchus destructor]|nr:hypothetical protein Ddc_14383 [Ditylenchus destructor]
MLIIFFEANDDTESKEKAPQIIHVMLQNFLPKISDRYEALSTMTDYLYNHGSLNGIQQYTIEDSRFQISNITTIMGKIVRVDAKTYSMESYGSKTVQKIAHLSTSFLNEDLDNVSIIFFPEVYSHADLIALRYNNSLILLHKPTQKIVFIENYKDAMDIELIFTNDHMIFADLIQNGDNYIKYMNKQDKKNIHQMIDNEELRLIEINEDFEIHLDESINIQTIFIVGGDIGKTSICRAEED